MQNDTKQFQNFKKHQILHNKSLLKLINDCTRFGKAVTKLAINVNQALSISLQRHFLERSCLQTNDRMIWKI